MSIDRTAYQSESILTEGRTLSNDSWSTGMNCNQLVLAFADNTTTACYAPLAARTPDSLRATPLDEAWLFVRGRKAERVRKYDVTGHPRWTDAR